MDGLERGREALGALRARWEDPEAEARQRVRRRLVDRLPAVHEVAEGLAHPVHVPSPVVAARPSVHEAAFVVAEPSGQGEVVQTHPDVDAGRLGRAQHLGVVLDRAVVVVAGLGLESGPLERQPMMRQTVVGQEAEVLGIA